MVISEVRLGRNKLEHSLLSSGTPPLLGGVSSVNLIFIARELSYPAWKISSG